MRLRGDGAPPARATGAPPRTPPRFASARDFRPPETGACAGASAPSQRRSRARSPAASAGRPNESCDEGAWNRQLASRHALGRLGGRTQARLDGGQRIVRVALVLEAERLLGPEADLAQRAEEGAEVELALAEDARSEEHTSELQSQSNLVCRLLL